ncbi:MAG: aminomethyl-transferring glycine dehydrogenase, partial [Acidimicrobiales bacterium]
PQTIEVVRTRARPLGIEVKVGDPAAFDFAAETAFGLLLQYPATDGALPDYRAVCQQAHEAGTLVAMATDLLALTVLTPPGELGADVAVGSAQRFGVPLGYGGPHAAFFATRAEWTRKLPGRLIGVSEDAHGNRALRMALQTREQHIRREKATSNICTAQVLPAVLAAMYAVYHGPQGLRRIAERTHFHATMLGAHLAQLGVEVVHPVFFDTVVGRVPGGAERVVAAAAAPGAPTLPGREPWGVNLRLVDADHVGISCDERTTRAHYGRCLVGFHHEQRARGLVPEPLLPEPVGPDPRTLDRINDPLPADLRRTSRYLTHPVFHRHRSETSMLRYLRRLADRDYGLDRGMIPLGSCTMKLNATFEMEPISWPGFASIHPFAPPDQTEGYATLIADLEEWLKAISGFAYRVSLQPNAGSQGELAGLLAIRAYLRDRGQAGRDVCLIPTSAHGTNAASAVLAGMRVVPVACDAQGNVDSADLKAKIVEHGPRLAALMVTYPSTHGVYEEGIDAISEAVHDAGGLVYLDGANMNALVGLAYLGNVADVAHLNLHKTFCIPHGGGGPGVGPVAVRSKLSGYLPADPLHLERIPQSANGREHPEASPGPVAGAPWGSAGVLPITWAYIRLMGSDGLRLASEVAVMSANYLAMRLSQHFPVLYTGRSGLVAHECILDLRPLTRATGVTATDVAKRLVDYGFHAPTLSFPVAGTLMVEPTESEDLSELERFCEAMAAIRAEVAKVEAGEWPSDDNPLKGAPHTAASLAAGWSHPYTRAEAAYPLESLRKDKYWPPVGRVDEAWGDRHLLTTLPEES